MAMGLKDLIRTYPQFAWLKPGYQLILALIFLPLAALTVYILMNQEYFGERYFLLFIPFVSAFSLFHGLLAFLTGIYPLWITKSIISYWYDREKKKTWVSEVQIALALAMMASSLLIFFTQ
jgi:hypothetical protein